MIYPRIIAHRCGGALAPENTLVGLQIAARLGCRGVEFDAMLAADGVPVLIHDETLERTTSGSGRVADMGSTQLVNLDAGAKHHPAFAGEPLPTLGQALLLCAELGLWANVEIKPSVGQEVETGRVVARQAAAAKCTVLLSSFSESALISAADAAPQLPLTPEALRAVRDAGIPLACYTLNRRDDAERLLAGGVCAVFSDRPDRWSPGEM
jgi:glycerophosphoryl diester phosphodiesterase